MGKEISDDLHDEYYDEVSHDNGQSWSAPQPRPQWSRTPAGEGFLLHSENAFFHETDRNILWHFTNRLFQPSLAGHNGNYSSQVCITSGSPEAVLAGQGTQTLVSDFGFEQGLSVSFCHPCLNSRGDLLVPFYRQKADENGRERMRGFAVRTDLPHILLDVFECGVLIGAAVGKGRRTWTAGSMVPFDGDAVTRGLSESAIAEIYDGRLAMVARGSNAGRPDLPGCKWLSFSEDCGRSWSYAQPLTYDDGAPFESSATGSALFRSTLDRNLYWIGNPCVEGMRANGNWPRTPLAIAQVLEGPFAIKRASLFTVDRAPDDNPHVQHSNFKFYQDHETGEVVIYLTRYGERGTANNTWLNADLYEYRIALHE